METKKYNSELRALLSIRNFNKALESYYHQMIRLEKDLEHLNTNAISTIESNATVQDQTKWKIKLELLNTLVASINTLLNTAKGKVKNRDRSDSTLLWQQFDSELNKLKESYLELEKFGFEILPVEVHKHWQKDICNYEDVLMPMIISHAQACKTELKMIEKYTPKELNKITQLVLNQIPENFTFEEADKYEEDYLKAVQELKSEFRPKKNLWDKFLDVLAGGTHQSPSERVMMKRWLEGEKQDL